VINGTWNTAHPEYRRACGEALMACGEYIAERIGAELVRVPDADHLPHRDRPEQVNACLRNIWTR
jgi:pimeloyl-ACP methyl ester carboxylesterase